MKTLSTALLIASLLLMAVPGQAAEAYRFTIDDTSPRYIPTGIVMQEGESIVIQAQGLMYFTSSSGFIDRAFSPAGCASFTNAQAPLITAPYGILMASTDGSPQHLLAIGALATLVVKEEQADNELFFGVNAPEYQLDDFEGCFEVTVIRYRPEEAEREVVKLNRDMAHVAETSIVPREGSKILVQALGNAFMDEDETWVVGSFGPAGQGFVRRDTQFAEKLPFGCLMGTFTDLNEMFYVGDFWCYEASPAHLDQPLKLALNMSEEDHHEGLHGMITAFVIHLRDVKQGN